VGDNTSKILAVTGEGGQIQSLYTFAGDNYNAIQSNTTLIGGLDTHVDQIQKTVDRHGTDITNISNATGETIVDLNSVQESIQIIENNYAQLNTLVINTANNVQSVISAQNSIRNRLDALENAPKLSVFVRSRELSLNQYQNGKMLVILNPYNYDPLRVVMKARDTQTGFLYVVNPGRDYGFNFRHATQVGGGAQREIEVAIGSAGLYLMTNGGSDRNILSGQRRDRFVIYAVMEFVSNELQSTLGTFQQDATDDGSLNY